MRLTRFLPKTRQHSLKKNFLKTTLFLDWTPRQNHPNSNKRYVRDLGIMRMGACCFHVPIVGLGGFHLCKGFKTDCQGNRSRQELLLLPVRCKKPFPACDAARPWKNSAKVAATFGSATNPELDHVRRSGPRANFNIALCSMYLQASFGSMFGLNIKKLHISARCLPF